MGEVQAKMQTEPRSSMHSKVSERENSLSRPRVEERLEASHAVGCSVMTGLHGTVGFMVSLDG